MNRSTVSADDGERITVHIPMTFRKRGGRKLVVTPDGAAWAPRPRVDNAMVKALAQAFRWRKMLDEGVHATLEDLARAKGVHATFVSRILGLTLLAPAIVEAILDGQQPVELGLDDLLEGFSLDWEGREEGSPYDVSPLGLRWWEDNAVGSGNHTAPMRAGQSPCPQGFRVSGMGSRRSEHSQALNSERKHANLRLALKFTSAFYCGWHGSLQTGCPCYVFPLGETGLACRAFSTGWT